MDITAQLSLLDAAQGDPAKLALTTVDLAFPELPEDGRDALKQALEAAAMPHWCDAAILASLLGLSPEESGARLALLSKLTVVEPFPARGETAHNVHEATRLALRSAMAAARATTFRSLSEKAAAHFAQNASPAGRIEWIYHRLCSAPDAAASELENLDREWSTRARPEDHQALAAALRELEEEKLVEGRAQVWVLLTIGWARVARSETAQLHDSAGRVLQLARRIRDERAEADAQCLLGDVFKALGKLGSALAAFGEALAIDLRLAEREPGNVGWQRELAVTHRRVGRVLEAQGDLEEAQAAYKKALAINQRLAALDSDNAGWQHDLAVAHSRVGGVLEAQGNVEGGHEAYEEALAITRRLVKHEPSNAGWQRDLAVAHSRVGGILEAQGKLAAAQAAFEEGLTICQQLAERDPSNAGWVRGLSVAYNCMGVLEAQGNLEAAEAAFGEDLAISRKLAEHDPSNGGWQRDLAVAHGRLGGVLKAQNKLEAAHAAFGEGLTISRRLAAQDPSNAGWQYDLAVAVVRVARAETAPELRAQRIERLREAKRIFDALIADTPDHAGWVRDGESVTRELMAAEGACVTGREKA